MQSGNWHYLAHSESDTRALGAAFAACLARWDAVKDPRVIYLHGELGSGKTFFARALIQSLGYGGRVKSPTYGLLESYQAGEWPVIHLDLFRIEDPGELEYLALRDIGIGKCLILIEWPHNGGTRLPPADLTLVFSQQGEAHVIDCIVQSDCGLDLARQVLQHPAVRPGLALAQEAVGPKH